MRLPRVRFTVGMLIFAVAVVALNLWAFRYPGARRNTAEFI
jgi:hypothetical protein